MIDLGAQSLKNIAEDVRVWRIDMDDTRRAGLGAALGVAAAAGGDWASSTG